MIRSNTLTMLAGAALFSAASVSAEAGENYALQFNPSELATVDGAEALFDRIKDVAEDYCDDAYGGRDSVRYRFDKYRGCIDGTVADLVAQVDHPRLTVVYEDARRKRTRVARRG